MKIRVGVIGLGFMGSAHARVYSGLDECELVALCEKDPSRAALAKVYNCDSYVDLERFLRIDLDAVSICTPTSTHKDIVLRALEAGKHVLVEKPLARNMKEGVNMIDKSTRSGCLLVTGYLERFNPAVQELKRTVDLSLLHSAVAFRYGPMPPAAIDSGVLLDLATHEIDVLNYLMEMHPKVLYSYLSNNGKAGEFEDYAFFSMAYGGLHSHVEASWLPSYKIRNLFLHGPDAFYMVDYAQQTLKVSRAPPRAKIHSGSWKDILRLSRNEQEEIPLRMAEPLELELRRFVESVRKGKVLRPLCTGQEGLEVLDVVEKIVCNTNSVG